MLTKEVAIAGAVSQKDERSTEAKPGIALVTGKRKGCDS